ncbi:ABC transporter substrate-binding protein [Bacillus horti]|uniref:Iron complex transport system substrate-binding protein n=1 Tax=Caldalkalibacillus horti TaxID=77523 RepID=A0ABT9W0X9_9BACI|nr:ABC transporter substrate-binding protein [Bacillus horti]MDQ0166500.1 iron complex transport system substrate-binding protein [Bacillus horti]
MKKQMIILSLAAFMAILTACSGNTESQAPGNGGNQAIDMNQEETSEVATGTEGEGIYAEIMDDAGRTVTLEQKPERILPLLPTTLDMTYAAGATPVGGPTIPEHIDMKHLPQEAYELPNVGHLGGYAEAIVEQQPDLVIGSLNHHDGLVDILSQSGIPIILLRINDYDDAVEKAEIFAQITGNRDIVDTRLHDMKAKISSIQDKLPEDKPKIAIVHINPRDVALELDGSIAGSAAKILGLNNVAAGSSPLNDRPDKTPYSIEKLVEDNPDKILLTTMGDDEVVQGRIRQDIENNPAWGSLQAVKDNEIYFLPQDLFLVHPGLYFDDAVEYMATLLYPEIFSNEP